MTANWYAIRTATRQEQKVVDGLKDMARERKIPLDVYLPCETRWNRMTRIKCTKQVPMLPGYLFLNVEPDHLWRVDAVEGVHQILGWGAAQTRKDATRLVEFVAELREAEDAGVFDKTQLPANKRLKLTPGEKARVCGGQFSGFIAEIVERKGDDRVKVLMTMFGRAAPMVIPIKHLEAQDAAPKEAA
jgi:transcription antitermination factor NusG